MKNLVRFALAFLIFSCLPITGLGQAAVAELVITNARIRTMDARRTVARSLAVIDGRIAAIGSETDTKPLIGPQTKVIDAGGRLVVPGFNDAHVHFMETGAQLASLDERTAASKEEFVRRLKDFAANIPKGRWILGGKWDHENWKPAELPTASLIDGVTPDHPVFIDRLDGHMALANSMALRLAGITRDTPDVTGGVIVRDSSGNPTGILKDAAIELVNKVIPAFSEAERLEFAEAASVHAASLGITSVHDMGFSTEAENVRGTEIGIYQRLSARGRLNTRVYVCSPLSDQQRWARTGITAPMGDAMLRVGCLKGYSDGSLGSRTAWMFEPYLDDPATSGLALEQPASIQTNVQAADKAGLQVNIHAIGDRANATVLDIYARTSEANGARDRRFRIEHAQHLRTADIKRFGSQKVVASMQPIHLIDDGRWAGKRLDEKRLGGSYAFRSLLDSGAVIAFGSDSPVAPINPLLGIYAAVTRRTVDDKNPNGWIPEQKITVDEAVRAFTWGSAYAEFQERIKGTLETGKLADMVILSDDIFTIDPVRIPSVTVMYTVVDGRVVYEKK